MRIGIPVWPASEIAFLAEDLGYFDNARIELVEFGSMAEMVHAFQIKSLDGMAATLDYALIETASEPRQRIIMAIDESEGGDAVVAREGVSNMRDLKGKRVGLEHGPLGAFVLHKALESANMTLEEITLVPVDLPDQLAAYREGKVDALVTYDPIRTRLTDNGAQVVFESSQTPGQIFDVLLVDQAVLQEKRPEVRTLVKGWLRAVNYYRNNPQEAADMLNGRSDLTAGQYIQAMERVDLYGFDDNVSLMTGERPPMEHYLRAHQAYMIDIATLGQSIPVSEIVDGSIIEELSHEKVFRE